MKKLFLLLLTVVLTTVAALAQGRTVTGTVISASDGEPLIGATVQPVGEGSGVATDADGHFRLTVKSYVRKIKVTYVGMVTQIVDIQSTAMIIKMSSTDNILDEVMVVAYGQAKKSSLTGAVSSISGGQIEKLSVSNVSKALEGAVPGVQVAMQSGQPGTSATVRIRGIGSINSSSSPLYVVDGVPFQGEISSINPADIESMNVLKDAASTALYGARAANGVILITTKRGSQNRTKVTLDVRLGSNSRGIPNYDVMTDPAEYVKAYWLAQKNTLGDGAAAAAQIFGDLGYNPWDCANDAMIDANGNVTTARLLWSDRWEDEALRNGFRQEYNLTVSGGNERSNHFLSLGYLDDEGIVANSDYSRLSMRASGNYDVNKYLQVNGNIAYARGEQNALNISSLSNYSNPFTFIQSVAPIYPVYQYDRSGNRVLDENGKPVYDFGDGTMGARAYAPNQNPVASNDANRNSTLTDNISIRAGITVNIWDGLKFQANGGYDVTNINRNQFMTPSFGDAQQVGGRGYKTRSRMDTYTINELLTYVKTFGKHTIDVMAGHENYYYAYNYLYNAKHMFFDPTIDEFNNAIVMDNMNSYTQKTSIESVFGRINYNFDDRYYISASIRGDGSSRFAPGHRWGTFWSLGASWRFSKESFMEGTRGWLDNASLRASYGTVGNDAILDSDGYANYYPYLNQYSVENADGAFSVSKWYQGNPELTWEKSANFNIGLTGVLFNNLLNLDVEYFYKHTSDMLYNVPQPPSSGVSYIPENAMTMNNSGVEFTLGLNLPMPKDWRLGFTFTGTHYKNEVTDIPENKRLDGITSGLFNIREGRSVYDFYTYEWAGLNDEGRNIYYVDKTDDHGNIIGRETTTNYANATKYYVGSAIPDFQGGLQMDLGWKGIDFSIGTNYQIGGKCMDYMYQGFMGVQAGFNFHRDMLDAWTPQNTNTNVPFLERDQNINTTSSRFLTDASFFNIRNITLGYSLPAELMRKAYLENLRVYVTADNVALFSKRKGLDPRQYISGSSQANYSAIRTIAAGIQLTF